MSKLTEYVNREIRTDGSFIYNCGFQLCYERKTNSVIKKYYDIALIGVLGARKKAVLPSRFLECRIKEIDHFAVFHRSKADAEKHSGYIRCDNGKRWWSPSDNIVPSSDCLTADLNARCDHVFVKGTYLNEKAFSDTRIRSVRLEGCSRSLAREAFYNCRELQKAELKSDYNEIGTSCFAFCEELKTIDFPESVKNIKSMACFHSGLISVVLPPKLKRIGEKAFSECFNLKAVLIPKNIESVSPSSFENCPNLQIVSARGSYGEKYAKKHRIPFLPYEFLFEQNLLL